MNVLLIQPPDPPQPASTRDSAHGHGTRFAPAWDLLCVLAHLNSRTRYTCAYFDARLARDLEHELADRVRRTPDLLLAVIHTSTLGLGPAGTVTDILRRASPRLRIAICGPHPSHFPELSDALPAADCFLSGDPEPVVRNLLDHLDVEHRLRRVPGLRLRGQPPVAPQWLPDLKSLTLPDWNGILWDAYAMPLRRQGAFALMRVSRGHTRAPADRTVGGESEPLRVWPMDRAALALGKCASAGIVETHLSDPPGFWSEDRLLEWCRHLDRAHNTQPWSLQLPPRPLADEPIRALQLTTCRRVEFLLDSSFPERRESAGGPSLGPTIAALQAADIEAQVRFYVGGPDETKGEADRIVQQLDAFGFCPFALQPFPVEFDSPYYREKEAPGKPVIESWIRWARDPWSADRPVALWGGEKAREYVARTMAQVEDRIVRNPRHRILRFVDRIRTARLIDSLENAALSFFRDRAAPPP